MSQSNDGRKAFVANVAIARALRVKIGATAGEVEIAGADELGIGSATESADAGRFVNVRLDNWSVEGIAGAAIAEGAELESAAVGKIITKAAGVRIGIALEAAAADGDRFEYMPAETR